MGIIRDRRDAMSVHELLEELELSRADLVADFEPRHPDAINAVADGDLSCADPDEIEDLEHDLRDLLRV